MDQEQKQEQPLGFVCPEWALEIWDRHQCSIEKCTDGNFIAVDHSIQDQVYIGKTRPEVTRFLGHDG